MNVRLERKDTAASEEGEVQITREGYETAISEGDGKDKESPSIAVNRKDRAHPEKGWFDQSPTNSKSGRALNEENGTKSPVLPQGDTQAL